MHTFSTLTRGPSLQLGPERASPVFLFRVLWLALLTNCYQSWCFKRLWDVHQRPELCQPALARTMSDATITQRPMAVFSS